MHEFCLAGILSIAPYYEHSYLLRSAAAPALLAIQYRPRVLNVVRIQQARWRSKGRSKEKPRNQLGQSHGVNPGDRSRWHGQARRANVPQCR